MKVILLAPTPPPAGGIAGWTERMMSATLKDDWQVVIVDERVTGSRQVFGEQGKKTFFDEIKRCFRIWKDLNNKLKDPEVKVVHSCIPSLPFSMMRELVCAGITHFRNRKFIIHFRCTVPNTTRGMVGNMMLKWLCRVSDVILSLNTQTSSYLQGRTKTPVRLIPNFVVGSELIEDRPVREELKTALYVGGLVVDKGINDCIAVAKHFPEIAFRFVGNGDAIFEERARQEGLKNVVFTGGINKEGVKEELAKADVFLFLSFFRGEGFSNALCEAMAAGLPCIVSDWAANADMVGTSGGIVVPVNDVEAACSAMERLKDKGLRQKMSEANIRKVSRNYLEEVVLGEYVAVYNDLTNITR